MVVKVRQGIYWEKIFKKEEILFLNIDGAFPLLMEENVPYTNYVKVSRLSLKN